MTALSPSEVEAYLHSHIPISSAMGVRVIACDRAGVRLSAPLAPNINHRSTVFGGSASAVAILAAWTWLYAALRTDELPSRLVIQSNTIDYLAPIEDDFEVFCGGLSDAVFGKFLRTLRRYGKARAEVSAVLDCSGATLAKFRGDYVALLV